MSQPKHTPGPWKSVRVEAENKILVRTVKPRRVLFELQLHSKKAGNPTNLADARLIAEAPTLLECAKAVMAIADRDHRAFIALRAAIARAEGRQQ